MTQLGDEITAQVSALPVSDSNYSRYLRHSPYLHVVLNIIMLGAWVCGIGIYWEAITLLGYASHLGFHLLSMVASVLGAASAVSTTFFFGRRRALVVHMLPIIPAYILMPLYQGAHWCDLLSRLLGHFAIGGYLTAACVYIGEVCLACRRVANYTIFVLCLWLGYVCYDLVFRVHPMAALALTVLPLAYLVLACVYLPESPYYVHQLQEREMAAEIIHFLRCGPLLYKQMEYLSMERHAFSYEHAICVHAHRWQLCDRLATTLLLTFFTTFSGVALVLSQMSAFCHILPAHLRDRFGYSEHDLVSVCDLTHASVTCLCACVGCGVFAWRGDGWGRRWLLVISFAGTTVAHALILVQIFVPIQLYLLQVGAALFVLFFFCGQAQMPFVLIGETFPYMLKCCYCAYGVASFFVMLIAAFIIAHAFFHSVVLLLAFHILVSVIAMVFTMLLIPTHACFSLEAVENDVDVSNTTYKRAKHKTSAMPAPGSQPPCYLMTRCDQDETITWS